MTDVEKSLVSCTTVLILLTTVHNLKIGENACCKENTFLNCDQ